MITNVQLFKWNIVENDLCSFCKEEKETLTHLLFHCHVVQALWRRVIDFLQDKYHIKNIVFELKNVIFNMIVPQKKTHVANLVCLIVKRYIYRERCLKREPQANMLFHIIRSIESIEKYIAIMNGKLHVHLAKWHPEPEVLQIRNYIEDYVNNV